MAKKDLETEVQERKFQAERRKIEYKAIVVAEVLGELTGESHTSNKTSKKTELLSQERISLVRNEYHDDVMNITYTMNWWSDGVDGAVNGTVEIKYGGREVFSTGIIDIKSYVPGAWERRLNALYRRATPMIGKDFLKLDEQERKRQMKADRKTKRARWGL